MQLLINTTSPFGRTAHIALIEKGFEFDVTYVNPWADDPELMKANTAGRVPALVLDSGEALTECMLICQWAEAERPEPSLYAGDGARVIALSGVAMGVVEAAVHTLVGRVITSGALTEPAFDDAPVGQRRRRSMITGLERIDEQLQGLEGAPFSLAAYTPIVALDYIDFRFPDAAWIPQVPRLRALRDEHAERPSIKQTLPREA